MCYAVMAHVTDYDVWHVSEEPVTVELVLRTLETNALLAHRAIAHLVQQLPEKRGCACGQALSNVIVTKRDSIPATSADRLRLLVGRHSS